MICNRSLRHVALILLFAAIAAAQSAIDSATLNGTVLDPDDKPVADAAIVLVNSQTGQERSTSSAAGGDFHFLLVPPGTYDVRASKSGFQTNLVKGIRLVVGDAAAVSIKFALGAVSEVVEVSAASIQIEMERTSQSNALVQEFVRNLPIDRRDYLTFTLLAPGVVDSNGLADNSDFRVTQTPTSGLSFYGSNGRGNSVTVDGGEANDAAGGVRANLSQEAVEEFQVNRSDYAAEFGGSSGGVINIVSKFGSNNYHGSLFAFLRHQSLDATDPFAYASGSPNRMKPDAKRQQFGGSIGGPITKDRTFFFAAAEGLVRDESNAISLFRDRSIFGPTRDQETILSRLPAAAAAQLRPALTASPATVSLFETNGGIAPFTSRNRRMSIRLDHSFSDKDRVFFRLSHAGGYDTNASTKALVGSSRGSRSDPFDVTALVGWTRIFSPNLINDFRLQGNYYNFAVDSTEKFGPELNIAGFGFFNKDIFLPFDGITRRMEIKDTLALIRSRHTFKAGATVLIRGEHQDSRTFFGGRFNFGSLPGSLVNAALASTTLTALQAFNLGLPQSYQQGFGDPVVSATYPFYGFFAQDTWKAARNLSLDFGLRYDIDTRKSPLPTDKNNIAPRFGLSWDPFGDGKTSVRAGYGIFYAPHYFQLDYVANALGLIDGRRQIAQVLTTIQTTGPAAANNIYSTLLRQGAITIPAPTRMIQPADLTQFGITVNQTGPTPPFSVLFQIAPNLVNPYSQQATLGVERDLGHGLTLSLSGIWTRTLKIPRSRDLNLLPAPVSSTLGIRVWRTQDFANPLLFQNNIYESSANAYYRAFTLELQKRLSRAITLAGNYTLSRAEDEVTDFNSDFQANDQTNLHAERALSSFHQRHKVVAYSVWNPGKGISVSGIFRANSGRPFNLLAGSDVNQDRHSTTDRPIGAGRNTGIGPAFYTFDLRLSKRVNFGGDRRSVEFLAESFNLFNHLNYASINNTVGLISGPFNLTGRDDRLPSDPLGFTSAYDPRRIQLGARLQF